MTLFEALALGSDRSVLAGSEETLADAIRRGSDLRIATAFRHNEHIDTTSSSDELVEEVAEFRQTLLVDDRWSGGIMTLRMPVELPVGFGPRPSMSFFLYNQDGHQAIGRPHLDGQPATGDPGPSEIDDHSAMPRYHQLDGWDAGTNAPSSNFIYDFEYFRFLVNDRWTEVLSHGADGGVISGSVADLADGFAQGMPVKLAIAGLCDDLALPDAAPPAHEIFVHAGSSYYYTAQKLFMTGTHPLVRLRPSIPLKYVSEGWDFGWLMARSDGQIERWMCNPYTLKFVRSRGRYAIRWLVAK